MGMYRHDRKFTKEELLAMCKERRKSAKIYAQFAKIKHNNLIDENRERSHVGINERDD